MIEITLTVGRLIEVRATSPTHMTHMDAFIHQFGSLMSGIAGSVVACVDLRQSSVLDSPVADRLLELLRRDNPRVLRSGFLRSRGNPTLWMQVDRMIHEAANVNRKAFDDPAAMIAFLAPVLSPPEHVRLREFLSAH